MPFKYVFFSMAIVLILLFVFSHFFRKKEISLSKVEADYFTVLRNYQTAPTPELLNQAKSLAETYGQLKGLSTPEIEQMIKRDFREV